MKTKVGFISIVIITIIVLGLRASVTEVDAQAADEVNTSASVEADLARMKRTATESCERLGQYLEEIEKSEEGETIPTDIRGFLEKGCGETATLSTAVADGDQAAATKRFSTATRAMDKVSRWLLEREEDLAIDIDDKKSVKDLQKILKRMGKQIEKLQRRVAKNDWEIDFSASYTLYEQSVTSLQNNDVQATLDDVRALRQAIFELEDDIASAQQEESL